MADYYAATNGTSGGSGTIGSPWDLQTALSNGSQTSGDTLWLRGGTYAGPFTSTLTGGTVRSYCYALPGALRDNPSEWAVIDRFKTTTLSAGINSSVTTFDVASTSGMIEGMTVTIDIESIYIATVVDSNTIEVIRGWSATTPVSHSNGATVVFNGPLLISGNNTTYRDFEVKHSWTERGLGVQIYEYSRGSGIVSYSGAGNSYINIITHDNVNGFFIGSGTSNTLIYGTLVYNNGLASDQVYSGNPSGTGLYLENESGYSRVYDCLILNNLAGNTQLFGVSGAYVGGDVQNTVFANAGAPMDYSGGSINLIYGPDSVASPTGSVTNSHFVHLPGMTGSGTKMGYGAGITTLTYTGNRHFGGLALMQLEDGVVNATVTDNLLYDPSGLATYTLSTETAYTWNNNTYYGVTSSDTVFGDMTDATNYNFADWKTQTGFDSTSTITASAWPNVAIVLPNIYETGRCNILIYAPGETSINVDLSTSGLVNGQPYTVKNAFNWDGSDVATGTYNSGSPTVSMPLNGAATSVATPIGASGALVTPSTLAPNFVALVLLPGAAAETAPASVGGNAMLSNVILG